jgi:hypothetical protein
MHDTQVLDRQDNFKAGHSSVSPSIARRTLKIESLGDPWCGKVFAGIRLKGTWLARAGFRPGERVAVILVEPGIMQIRSIPESARQAEAQIVLPLQLVLQGAQQEALLARNPKEN